jgi:beta-galactosidase
MRGANFVRRSFANEDRKGRQNTMDRRDFLKTASTVIAGGTLAPVLLASKSAPGAANADGRLVFPINRNWRYNQTFVEGAHARQFDDSAFERVVIPHTNVRLPWHSFDDKQYQFVSIYRRHFRLPAEARGKRVFVDFEGVMTASTVWINGVQLGEYKGGYTPFSFDLTPHIDFGGENVLAVDVDSTERPDIPPFGNQIDYLTFGGIYREVWLRIVPTTFIENVFAKPNAVLSEHPGLDVDCFLQHKEASHEALMLEVELREGDHVLAKATQRPTQWRTSCI